MSKCVFMSFVCFSLVLTACGKNSANSPRSGGSDANGPQGKNWPPYATEKLSGAIAGKKWEVGTATAKVVEVSGESGKTYQTSLTFYHGSVSNACGAASVVSSEPYVTILLPTPLNVKEYSFDSDLMGQQSGNPANFVVAPGDNMMASRTKVQIDRTGLGEIKLSLYAYATGTDGVVSEINGTVIAEECSSVMDFKEWTNLNGYYKLTSFDGVKQDGRTSIIENAGANEYFDRATQKWLSAINLPLYTSVGANSDMKLDLGPINGLGRSTKTESNGVVTLTYSYHGPVYTNKVDVTLNLDIKIVKTGDRLDISYTAEIPKYVTKTSHQFVLTK